MFKKLHPEVGARPGTLRIASTAPAPKIRLIQYAQDFVHDQQVHDPRILADRVGPNSVTWVDVQGLGDAAVLQAIAETFGLHPLAMEDVVNVPQRPKTESYDAHQLIICRMVSMRHAQAWDLDQVSIVFGPNYVLTFQQQYGDKLDPVRGRIHQPTARLRSSGSDYLAYAILDTIIDAYYPVLESLGDQLQRLEDLVIDRPSPGLLRQLSLIKNRVVNLRRAIWPQREAVHDLLSDGNALVSDRVRMFLRDTYDHCFQTTEVVEMYRETVTGLMNTYLSAVAHRTNEVMKVLTIMASLFIPLSFLAGIYGMNFENMPELQFRWAYPTFWFIITGVVVTMLSYFRYKGWIGRGATDIPSLFPEDGQRPAQPDQPPAADSATQMAVLDHDVRGADRGQSPAASAA